MVSLGLSVVSCQLQNASDRAAVVGSQRASSVASCNGPLTPGASRDTADSRALVATADLCGKPGDLPVGIVRRAEMTRRPLLAEQKRGPVAVRRAVEGVRGSAVMNVRFEGRRQRFWLSANRF